jgi:hypothetical protein
MDRFEITGAPCQSGVNPEIFFPDPTDRETILEAKSYCLECKVTSDCLTFGMKTNSFGIWGGTTDEERRAIKRKMQRSK